MKFSNLICPLCQEPLAVATGHLRCPNSHSFDVARQGYVNLLPVQQKKSKHPGDSKSMVAARSHFLSSGVYAPIAEEVAGLVLKSVDAKNLNAKNLASAGSLCILDAGCGEGYYLDALVRALHQRMPQSEVNAVGLDISKDAIQAAAKRNPHITWIVGTNARPPLQVASVDLLLCLFGFPSYEGFARVLKAGGKVLLVDPGPEHLIELRRVLYPEVKRSPLPDVDKAQTAGFTLADLQALRFQTPPLVQEQLQQLLTMTPYIHRATAAGRDAAAKLDGVAVTVDLALRTLGFRPTASPAPDGH